MDRIIKGTIIKGNKLGREVGYPTINIEIFNKFAFLEFGVYSCLVKINENKYKGLMHYGNKSIGSNDADKIYCEIHLLETEKELYDKKVEIEILKKIRDVRKFKSIESLRKQITRDLDISKKQFTYGS